MLSTKHFEACSQHTQAFKSSDNFKFYFGSFVEDFFDVSSGGESSSSSIADPTEKDFLKQIESFPKAASQKRRASNATPCSLMTSQTNSFRNSQTKSNQKTNRPSCYVNSTDEELLWFVIDNAVAILTNTPNKIIKAVELANVLKKKVGRKLLARVKDLCGGLLFLLERHSQIFIVHRIPKRDMVQLALNYNYLDSNKPSHVNKQAQRRMSRPHQASIPFLDIDQLLADFDYILEEADLYRAPLSEPSVSPLMDAFETLLLPTPTYTTVW